MDSQNLTYNVGLQVSYDARISIAMVRLKLRYAGELIKKLNIEFDA